MILNPTKDLIEFREGRAQDLPFIMSSWRRGMRFGNKFHRPTCMNLVELVPESDFNKSANKIMSQILNRENTKVRVACLKEDLDVALGFSIQEGETLHWVFVKLAWRNLGLAKELVTMPIKQVTHLSKAGEYFLNHKLQGVQFNPYA